MEGILNFTQNTSPLLVYSLLFFSAYMENIFPPVPGDTVVIFGAYLVGVGKLNFLLAFFFTTLGSISGFMTLFYLSYVYGEKILEKRILNKYKTSIGKVERWFEKYGYGIILFNRFLSGARSVISIFSGISKLKPIKVFFYATISCVVWNFILIFLGYKLGSNWEVLVNLLKKYNRYTLIAIFLFLLILFLKKLCKKKKER